MRAWGQAFRIPTAARGRAQASIGMSCQPIAGYEREMFSAGCTMNIGSKKLLREVASTFCGAQVLPPLVICAIGAHYEMSCSVVGTSGAIGNRQDPFILQITAHNPGLTSADASLCTALLIGIGAVGIVHPLLPASRTRLARGNRDWGTTLCRESHSPGRTVCIHRQ